MHPVRAAEELRTAILEHCNVVDRLILEQPRGSLSSWSEKVSIPSHNMAPAFISASQDDLGISGDGFCDVQVVRVLADGTRGGREAPLPVRLRESGEEEDLTTAYKVNMP